MLSTAFMLFKPEELIPRTDDFNLPVFANVDIKPNTLSALLTLPKLTDNSLANTRFFDASLTTHNQRLHLYNFKMQHPVPSMLEQMNTAGGLRYECSDYQGYHGLHQNGSGRKRVQITPKNCKALRLHYGSSIRTTGHTRLKSRSITPTRRKLLTSKS